MSATNTYEGATTILGGTISISSDRNLGAVPSTFTAAALSINGGTLSVSESLTLDTARGITLGTNDATLTVASGKSLIAASVITGLSGADLTKSGTGTLGVTASNTYVGTTTVSQGILNVSNATGLGGSSSGQGTTVSANAAVEVTTVDGLSVAEAADLLRTKRLSPVEYAQALIAHAERHDRHYNAFLRATPEIALEEIGRAHV